MLFRDVERHRDLAGSRNRKRRHAQLDDEIGRRAPGECGVAEAFDLLVLREQVRDVL